MAERRRQLALDTPKTPRFSPEMKIRRGAGHRGRDIRRDIPCQTEGPRLAPRELLGFLDDRSQCVSVIWMPPGSTLACSMNRAV